MYTVFTKQETLRVVFLYGPPANCYVAYTVIRRNIVFICNAIVNTQNWIHVDC